LPRRQCGSIVRILRRLSEPPVGLRRVVGLSRGQGRRGARRNRGVSRQNRALPTRDRAPTVPNPCEHGHERTKPYSVGQRPNSVVHPAAHGLQRGRATLQRSPATSRRLGEPSKNSKDTPARAASQFHRAPTVPSPCGHDRERAKPYSVGQRTYSVVHPTVPSPCGHSRERAKPYSVGQRSWPPVGPSHPPEATGGLPAARRAFVKF